MEQPITDLAQVSPEWLTRVLQKQGVLPHGKVTAVLKKSQSTFTAHIVRLEARYDEGAPLSAPIHLFLKMSNPNVDAVHSSAAGQHEVAFYTTVVEAMSDPPTVRCYDAAYAPQTGHYHMLLADVSDTHGQPEWSLLPTQRQCEDVLECMAKFHAFWWEHPRLGQDIGTLPTAEGIKGGITDTESKVRAFIDFLGDRLSEDRHQIYDKVLAAMPRLSCHLRWARLSERKAFTLVHGDPHWWNFLYPQDAARDRVYLIDWQAWRIALGTDDLAYMMALAWYPERRRRLERVLLRRYHQALLREGVANYAWHECWFDYRVSAIRNLFVPVLLWTYQVPAATWWSLVERAMLAFDDLGCEELLAP